MNSQDSRRARVNALVFQDQGINKTDLKEFQMHLESSILAWERKGRILMRVIWVACGFIFADVLAVLVIEGVPALRGSGSVRVVWGTFGAVSFMIAAVCLVWYNDKYAPALRRFRFDLQMSVIRELHQQLDALRQEMNRRHD